MRYPYAALSVNKHTANFFNNIFYAADLLSMYTRFTNIVICMPLVVVALVLEERLFMWHLYMHIGIDPQCELI